MSLDFSKLCRVCLDPDKEKVDIFAKYLKLDATYSNMLSRCTKSKPTQNDGLPRQICKPCVRSLKKLYTFNLQCEKSEKRLRQIIGQAKELTESFTCNIKSINNKDSPQERLSCADSLKNTQNNISELVLLCYNNDKATEKHENNVSINPFEIRSNQTNDAVKTDLENNAEENHSQEIKSEINIEDLGLNLDTNDIKLEHKEALKTLNESKHLQHVNNNEDCKDEVKIEQYNQNGVDDDHDDWSEDNENGMLNGIKDELYEDPELNKAGIKEKKTRRKKGEPRQLKAHQCDVCGKTFSTSSNMRIHKISHTNLRPYKCVECVQTFRSHSALKQHSLKHSGETPYHCEYCPKQFSRKSTLIDHVKIHTGEKQFSCEVCCKKFTQRAQLSTHLQRHRGDKPFLCHDCGKGFPVKEDLKTHLRVHSGEKPYSCTQCDRTFATSGNLAIHLRVHNREIRYRCPECDRGFVTWSSYDTHKKRHKGQKDYVCECGKTFYTSSSLKQHKITHTGEKKYQCKLCPKKFSQSSHLNRHFKKDHKSKMAATTDLIGM